MTVMTDILKPLPPLTDDARRTFDRWASGGHRPVPAGDWIGADTVDERDFPDEDLGEARLRACLREKPSRAPRLRAGMLAGVGIVLMGLSGVAVLHGLSTRGDPVIATAPATAPVTAPVAAPVTAAMVAPAMSDVLATPAAAAAHGPAILISPTGGGEAILMMAGDNPGSVVLRPIGIGPDRAERMVVWALEADGRTRMLARLTGLPETVEGVRLSAGTHFAVSLEAPGASPDRPTGPIVMTGTAPAS
jgi:hypothetical protein